MGSGGGIWETDDLLSHDRLNQKTNLFGTLPITTFGGMLWMDSATGEVRQMSTDLVHWEVLTKGTVDNSFRGVAPNTSSPANPNTASTISFVNGTRTFHIAPTGADFRLYVSGVEYIFTTDQTVQITATEGLWYIYFNSSGVLTASQSVWDFESVCPVAHLYWDNTNSICIYFGDERHQIIMDWRTHQYLHLTVGCRYASGLVISGYTLNSSGDTNVEIGLNNGILFDEDLQLSPTNGVSGTPASTSNFYYQPLSKPATIPVYYQVGANNVWRKQTTANFYVYPHTANTTLYYNQYTGGAWQLTDVPSTNYVSYWIFGTNDIDNPIIAIMGQQQNSTLANAVTNDTFSALSISPSVNGILFLEMKILFQIILRCQNSYAGTTFSRVIQVNDYREVSNMQSSTIGPSANYITSVDAGYFTVTSGQLLFSGSHAQAVGSTDSPSFAGLTVGTLVFPTSGNLVTGLVTETAVGITLTASNPTGAGTAYYTPSISGNLAIGAYGITFTAIADGAVAGKLFLSSTTANTMKYYDGSSGLHSLVTLDLAQSFSGVQTFTAEPVINVSGSGAVLELYNPANTFYYTLTTGAIAATHALNLPIITADDTLAVLGLAQSFTAVNTFTAMPVINVSGSGSVLKLYNPANTHFYTITTGAIAGDYALNLPVITAADTVEVLGLAQTISAVKTFTAKPVINVSGSGAVLDLYNPANTFIYTITTGAIAASHALNLPVITADDTVAVLALAQTFSGAKTFGAGLTLSNSQAIAFGTGGSITFTDHTAVIGSASNYVATIYANAITGEGTTPSLSGFTFGTTTFTSQIIVKTASANLLQLWNAASTFYTTLTASAFGANYTLTIPVLTASDTLVTLGLAQTFTGAITFNGALAGTHGQSIGTGDSPTFSALTLNGAVTYSLIISKSNPAMHFVDSETHGANWQAQAYLIGTTSAFFIGTDATYNLFSVDSSGNLTTAGYFNCCSTYVTINYNHNSIHEIDFFNLYPIATAGNAGWAWIQETNANPTYTTVMALDAAGNLSITGFETIAAQITGGTSVLALGFYSGAGQIAAFTTPANTYAPLNFYASAWNFINASSVTVLTCTSAGALTINSTIQAGGYKSSDGTAGMTGNWTPAVGHTAQIKNGLIVSAT